MSKKPRKEFVLRDMMTGLYATGKEKVYGTTPRSPRAIDYRAVTTVVQWGKRPKRWKSLCTLKTWLKYVNEPIKTTWEVLEFEITATQTGAFSAATLVEPERVAG